MWIGTCQEMVTKQPSPHFPLLCVLSDPPQANPERRQNWMGIHCLDKKEAGGYGGGSEGDAGGHEGDGGGGGVPKEMTTLLSCVRVCCMIIRTAVVQAQTPKSL